VGEIVLKLRGFPRIIFTAERGLVRVIYVTVDETPTAAAEMLGPLIVNCALLVLSVFTCRMVLLRRVLLVKRVLV
jgi:hypothetical protein